MICSAFMTVRGNVDQNVLLPPLTVLPYTTNFSWYKLFAISQKLHFHKKIFRESAECMDTPIIKMNNHVYSCESSIRGYHIYKDIWDPRMGEKLSCLQEPGNVHDIYAVSVMKGDDIVGHVPRNISYLCYFFLE